MKTSLALACILAASASCAAAAHNYLFAPMDGIRIGTSETSPGQSLWSIQQFESPPLPSFVGNWSHDASAGVLFTPGHPATVRLRATSYGNPCLSTGGNPIEQDLFLHGPKPAVLPSLASLRGMAVGVDLRAQTSGPSDQLCNGVSAAGQRMFNAVVVSIDFDIVDPSANQDFSYGIAAGKFGEHAGTTDFAPSLQNASWFQHSATAFGYAEPITDYNDPDGVPYAMLMQNVWTPFDFDVLAHIEAAIAAGGLWGMDPNLADWEVAGVTVGEHDWGHSQLVVYARGMQVTTRP